jgi:hypothetical protein
MSHEQKGGQNHNVQKGNKSNKNVANFKYFGMIEQIIIKFSEKLRAH